VSDNSIIAAKLGKAQAQLQAATTKRASPATELEEAQAELARRNAQFAQDPNQPQEVHVARGDAKRKVAVLTNDLNFVRQQLGTVQADAARWQTLLVQDQTLAAVKERWGEASAAEVSAVKAAEGAREELARLDALLAEETAKTEAAQIAQSVAILTRLGFRKAPASDVSDAEKVLIGSAATVDALRTARPDLVAVVAEADAAVARYSTVTRKAEQDILDVKQVMAEGHALLTLEACRAAVQAYHVATIAAKNHFGERLSLYTIEDLTQQQQAQADQLRARAAVGE
jgi:hypothetical protein